MAHAGKTYDVFITHSPRDASFAMEVASAFRESGLEAVTNTELMPFADSGDAVWDALAESRALLTIIPPTGPTPSMGIEIGAAQAWNKPIYALVTEPSFTRLPAALTGAHLYTTGRLQDVIQEIRSSARQLTDEDCDSLTRIYAETGIPVDQLAVQPAKLHDITKKFNSGRAKAIGGERLLSELLRLRKRGILVKGRSKGRATPTGESA
jgi:hypothetical protein